MPLIRFSINNPLLTNLMLGIVVVLGVLSWRSMPQEMFPTIELDKVRIQVEFEGASPEEVERQVTIPVEEEFDGMAEIDVMTSTSHEGMSSVIIKLKSGTDVDQFMRDAQTALDQITDLPEEAEEPELIRLKARFPVISMTLYGDVARGYLYDLPMTSNGACWRCRAWPRSVLPATGTGRSGSRWTRTGWRRAAFRSAR